MKQQKVYEQATTLLPVWNTEHRTRERATGIAFIKSCAVTAILKYHATDKQTAEDGKQLTQLLCSCFFIFSMGTPCIHTLLPFEALCIYSVLSSALLLFFSGHWELKNIQLWVKLPLFPRLLNSSGGGWDKYKRMKIWTLRLIQWPAEWRCTSPSV